ncbi:MAG: hypothetical protein COS82_09375 [Zetaproteobacteria bacterium CG06_land_8_20_14_3_00_59_53]|nr:MAG: hypothetical protein AUK36_09885 [Zetaproteobacteria bacterium CG2_30_59_37]PIO90753.1 MAG: hypothetical protein COX56_01045 [Zetaproteobacteria bacterium CG23_combo_of_CG06-09_8_20_14_all_59_86]PIQ65325.1 MAG: hypothetical protein COV97_04645 [Zetaproteobacteria bacterium CG11_big_fil_rev_8_21_14_0_20_59_439]PIU69867.1 MAG: hypothetical protein COS82_09375 [Zetaproteobacteria bacterium CG06_land_8_20_14_3_00_59_53]PIU97393.1 MAG: hypothetical protein COS62_04085 [Zetaproteobacteria bac
MENPQQQPVSGELGAIMPLIGFMSSHVRFHISRICSDAGHPLTPEEAGTLMIIRHFKGLPQTRLAVILGKDKAAVTRLMNALVKSGLVGRIPDEQDRRVVRAQITGLGEQAFIKLWPELTKLSDEALKDIPKQDLEQLSNVLRLINANLAALTGKYQSCP